jgi:hypothetical protein
MSSRIVLLIFYPIGILSSFNINYYPIVPVATNPYNVSSFQACLCACFVCYDCQYFSYWLSNSSSTCQIYNIYADKPDIASYTRMTNDNQTGLYIGVPSTNACQWSSDMILSLNYTGTTPKSISIHGMSIVSLLAISTNQLLAINKNNNSYYFIDQDTFQVSDMSLNLELFLF